MTEHPRSSAARRADVAPRPAWSLGELEGRIVELTGAASLTLVCGLVLEAQRRCEPVAWITCRTSTFFPPDVQASGIDLDVLPVVRTVDARTAARAADHLIRSGAFGLVVLDLGRRAQVPMPLQSRLVGLAQKHSTAVVCITDEGGDRSTLGSLVSLRARTSRKELGGERFTCTLEAGKDKRRGPGWSHREVHHGPPGLR